MPFGDCRENSCTNFVTSSSDVDESLIMKKSIFESLYTDEEF